MWQLYQEHNYYYLLLYYSFYVKPIGISVLLLFKQSTRIPFVCILEYH